MVRTLKMIAKQYISEFGHKRKLFVLTIVCIAAIFVFLSRHSVVIFRNSVFGGTSVLFKRRDDSTCDVWAVVTTIFEPSDAVRKVARDPNLCVVVVADAKTPTHAQYVTGIKEKNNLFVYLSLHDQDEIFPRLSSAIPRNHFARKNIGYMYAIKHGAKIIWDFDDDNINLPPVDIVSKMKEYKTPCKNFTFHLFNPYPYFDVKETYTWPRGFPLQYIRDKRTRPELCISNEVKDIAVVQSLANIQPDVDAIYRFTRDTPFNFGATPTNALPVVVPLGAFTPFNGQATLWYSSGFMYMALPVTVPGRVSDIWRSYIAEYFFYRTSKHVAFVPPYVDQHRNPHDYIKDFNDELQLYQQANELLTWFHDEPNAYSDLLELYTNMASRGYIQQGDVDFISIWLKTLRSS